MNIVGVGNQGLVVPLGNLLPNIIWRLEQVLKESSKVVRIFWDFDKCGNTCEVGE